MLLLLDDAADLLADCPGYIEDHPGDAVKRLVAKMQQPNNQALARLSGDEIQPIEDEECRLIINRTIDASQGAQLDQWGGLVGEERAGFLDEEYRGFIKARILTNLSNGEINRLLAILILIMLADEVQYIRMYPAGHRFQVVADRTYSPEHKAKINRQLDEAAPSGVENGGIVHAVPGYFGFAGDPDAVPFGQGPFPEVI